MAIHAIGDKAVDDVLAAYARGRQAAIAAGNKSTDCPGLAHRVEHVEHMAGPSTVAEFAKQGTWVVANPVFLLWDASDLNELASHQKGPGKTFAYRSLLKVDCCIPVAVQSVWFC